MTKVLVLLGSPRKSGNTASMCEHFAKGALDNGCEVEQVFLRDLNIQGCVGCSHCQRNGDGKCVKQDDMNDVLRKIQEADVIALASPVYYYTWTSWMKEALDRTYALGPVLSDKAFVLLSACAAPTEEWVGIMRDCFERYVSCFRAGPNRIGGSAFAYGASKKGEASPEALQQAYELGTTCRRM